MSETGFRRQGALQAYTDGAVEAMEAEVIVEEATYADAQAFREGLALLKPRMEALGMQIDDNKQNRTVSIYTGQTQFIRHREVKIAKLFDRTPSGLEQLIAFVEQAEESARRTNEALELELVPERVRIICKDRYDWVSETVIEIDPRWPRIECQFQIVPHADEGGDTRDYSFNDDHYRAVASQFINNRGRSGGRDDRFFILQMSETVKIRKEELSKKALTDARAATELKIYQQPAKITVKIHCYPPGNARQADLLRELGSNNVLARRSSGAAEEVAPAAAALEGLRAPVAQAAPAAAVPVEPKLTAPRPSVKRPPAPSAPELSVEQRTQVYEQARLYAAIAAFGAGLGSRYPDIARQWIDTITGSSRAFTGIVSKHESNEPFTTADQDLLTRQTGTLLQLFNREKQLGKAMSDYRGQVGRWKNQWETLAQVVRDNEYTEIAVELGYSVDEIITRVQRTFLDSVQQGKRDIVLSDLIAQTVDIL